jgi:hypothetical protein
MISELCEWDPERNKASRWFPPYEDTYRGCGNRATILVGAHGEWRLCARCASLPRFARFKRRAPLDSTGRVSYI